MANNWDPGMVAAFDQNMAHYDKQAVTMIEAWQNIGEHACCLEHHHIQFFDWLEPQLAGASWHDIVATFTTLAKKAAEVK